MKTFGSPIDDSCISSLSSMLCHCLLITRIVFRCTSSFLFPESVELLEIGSSKCSSCNTSVSSAIQALPVLIRTPCPIDPPRILLSDYQDFQSLVGHEVSIACVPRLAKLNAPPSASPIQTLTLTAGTFVDLRSPYGLVSRLSILLISASMRGTGE